MSSLPRLEQFRRLVGGVVYGPVKSRRWGLSLGINLSGPGKYCSFGCPYCFRGYNQGRPSQEDFIQSIPQIPAILEALKIRMASLEGSPVEDWTLAGNAEPTDHPLFPEIVEALIALRDEQWPTLKLSILTNGIGLLPRINSKYKEVKGALKKVDRPCLKLDAGTPKTWKALAAPVYGVTLQEWMEGAGTLKNVLYQTMLLKGAINNSSPLEIDGLCEAFLKLEPRQIQLYTINKTPANPKIKGLEEEEILRIKGVMEERLEGVDVVAVL